MKFPSLSTLIKSACAALAVAFLPAATSLAPVASAQGTTVIVYDQARVMTETKAGKDIAAKLKSMGESTKTALKPEGDSLEAERAQIAEKTKGMTEQQVAADPALRGQIETFARKANEYAQKVQRNGQELSLTERQAWTDFFVALDPVVKQVMSERGASIVLEASDTVLFAEGVDVTADVIAKLDAATPSIQVVRKTLPAAPSQP